VRSTQPECKLCYLVYAVVITWRCGQWARRSS